MSGPVFKMKKDPRVLPMADVSIIEDFSPLTRLTLTLAHAVQDARGQALYAIDDSAAVEASWQILKPLALVPHGRLHFFGYQGELRRDFIYQAGLAVRLGLS